MSEIPKYICFTEYHPDLNMVCEYNSYVLLFEKISSELGTVADRQNMEISMLTLQQVKKKISAEITRSVVKELIPLWCFELVRVKLK